MYNHNNPNIYEQTSEEIPGVILRGTTWATLAFTCFWFASTLLLRLLT